MHITRPRLIHPSIFFLQSKAYLTEGLAAALAALGKAGLESHPGLLPALLAGVGARLNSPDPPVRWDSLFVPLFQSFDLGY